MTAAGNHRTPGLGRTTEVIEEATRSGAAPRDAGELLRLERALSAELARLEDEFGEALTDEVVQAEFESCVRSFASARIRLYVPVLSYRNAREHLRVRALSLDIRRGEDELGPVSWAAPAERGRTGRRAIARRR